MENSLKDIRLNEQQLDMIRLLRNPMPEEYFLELKRLTIKLLGRQIETKVDEWETKNNITEDYYEKMSKEHFRSKKK